MDLSKLETIDDLKQIIRVGTIIVRTYFGIDEEPIGFENDEVIYQADFHKFFLIEKFNEGSIDGKEWDDFNTEPTDNWMNYCYLSAWEIYKY